MKAKVLLYDIETSPNLAYVWGKWEQNVIQFKKEFELLCFAYKWLGESNVYAVVKGKEKTDKKVCERLYELLNEADVIIAHNGDQFDNKKVKARFIAHGMKPTRHFATIDTKKIAKHIFGFNSNSLDDIGNYLGVGRKVKHQGFELWLGCMRNDPKCWEEMVKYNKQDVVLLEKVYLAMRPWMARHPHLSLLQNVKDACPKCGSLEIKKKGFRANFSTMSQQMYCVDCHGWFLKPYKRIV